MAVVDGWGFGGDFGLEHDNSPSRKCFFAELFTRDVCQAFEQAIDKETDRTMLILRARLFFESPFERIAQKKQRGNRVTDKGPFTFVHNFG